MIKGLINYISIYISGVAITSSFVLLSNDIFYDSVIKKIFIDNNFDKKLWNDIKPREIYGNGAKEAFLDPKHSLKDDDPFQTSKDYNDYILQKKAEKVALEEELEKIKQNIYDKKI
jgi:hypothetical protein